MKVAFAGKGGSGKTTLAALFARHLASRGRRVLALDADINQNLAEALGAAPDEAAAWPTLGEHLPTLKNYLRGDNPRISSAAAMVKTTPPGRGSRLLRPFGSNPVLDECVRSVGGVDLAVTGGFVESDLGVSCYHSKVGAVELILNHLVDGADEYVVVDMTAGADAFASGLFTRFDLTVVVCEPTRRSAGVYRQYVGHAREFDVAISVVGNKVDRPRRRGVPACARRRRHGRPRRGVRLCPRGRAGDPGADRRRRSRTPGRPSTRSDPQWMPRPATGCVTPATRSISTFAMPHAWGNARTGEDLTAQVDPDFVLGPAALAGAR